MAEVTSVVEDSMVVELSVKPESMAEFSIIIIIIIIIQHLYSAIMSYADTEALDDVSSSVTVLSSFLS